ncbi:Transcriptional regulator [Pseudomonas sp. IT-P12]
MSDMIHHKLYRIVIVATGHGREGFRSLVKLVALPGCGVDYRAVLASLDTDNFRYLYNF